ncbi:hypothetical protein B296_00024550 [Ensete ventricosum]|uniref:Ammonium transporter AmtB-like domain-containing protein n=1 Tax=Ensete ventricosum TaxID=4639 RepID=A0A426XVT0_ENSVE|nr:hypothetical protein B296_00024550 [Ensete ventricosum]
MTAETLLLANGETLLLANGKTGKVDDTLTIFHTHVVVGVLGGLLTSLRYVASSSPPDSKGTACGGGIFQLFKQLVGAVSVSVWNLVSTTTILLAIARFMPLRMSDDQLVIGNDAGHGEEAYTLWGDGERFDTMRHVTMPSINGMSEVNGARGVTIQL